MPPRWLRWSTIARAKYHRRMGARATVRSASPAAEAWSSMGELFHAYGRARMLAVASEFDLSPPQVMALRVLEPGEPVPMRELARALHCDNSNVTGIVDRLEDRGLVQRRGALHDRRVKMLTVTAAGADLRGQLDQRLSDPPEPLARLSSADQRVLRDIMRRALRR
jgi:MarR family transcriptional regulator, organic hydroperoxide resistance regulator